MKSIKKLIAVLICSIFVFTPSISVLAESSDDNLEARGCVHSVLIYKEDIYSYESPSATGHKYCVYKIYKCMLCDYTQKVKDSETNQNHSFSVSDLGHTGIKHSWKRYCSKCGYSEITTRVCVGPPCLYPFSLSYED